MEEFEEKLSLLFVGAHPDDPVFYCGGTIAKYTAQNHMIVLAIMSSILGEVGEARAEELRRAGKILGVKDVHFLGFDDGKVILDLDSREKTAKLMTKVAPDIVVTHHPNDKPWPDHPSTSDIVTAAWDYAKLPKGNSLYYWDTPVGRNVQPTMWIDTSDTFERKLEAAGEFNLELEWFGRHPETLLPEKALEKLPQLLEVEMENESEKYRLIGRKILGYCIKTIDGYRGLQIGVRYAEAFELKAGKRSEW